MTTPGEGSSRLEEALRQFRREAWQLLEQAVAQRNHPCRFLQLATIGPEGPESRTLVLRQVDAAQHRLLFHTDSRSAKVAQIGVDPRVAVLGYDARIGLQLRAGGLATLESATSAASRAWAALTPASRRLYQVAAVQQAQPTADVDEGYAHFTLLWVQLHSLDLLLLGPDGHRRAQFRADRQWAGQWVRE